jgi:hypothetical protein
VFTFLTVRFYVVGPSTPEWPLVCWRYGASWCSSWRERRPRSRPWLITPLDHHIPVPEPKRRHLALPFVRRRQGHAEQREVLAVLDPGKPQTRHGGVTAGIHQSVDRAVSVDQANVSSSRRARQRRHPITSWSEVAR